MSLFSITELTYPVWQEIIINLLLAFALGLISSWFYRWTYRGFSYSVSFVCTLILLAPITSFVMMVIGNSIARAFSLVGALSIIRFRTPLKDTRDTAFVLLSLGIGFATGTRAYVIATIGAILVGIFALALYLTNVGNSIKGDFLLRFRMVNAPNNVCIYSDIFDKHLKKNTLVNMATTQQGNCLELAFNVIFKDLKQQQTFIKELSQIPELEQVMLVAVDKVEEY